jgi:hypothetical protein
MTPSRYQSRLFNFFSRQSQRVGDSFGRSWRSVKVAANWSLEALLYPVFILVKNAVDSAGKQLKPQTAPQQPLLNSHEGNTIDAVPVKSDTAIVHVLEIIKKLPSRPTVNSLNAVAEKLDYVKYHQQLEISDTAKAYLPRVQGIATHLGNKHLVLVTADNKVLDILTLFQQQKLQDKIVAEVAEYWRLWRLSSQVQARNLSPEIDRLLYKITGGNTITQASVDEQKPSTQISKLYVSGLDAAIAHLEESAITVRRQAQQKFDIFLHSSVQTSQNQNQNPVDTIRALINLAINHFFGTSTTAINQHVETLTYPRRDSTDETELWLTFDDLFGEELGTENQAAPQNLIGASNQNQKRLNQYKAYGLATSQKLNSTVDLIASAPSTEITSVVMQATSQLSVGSTDMFNPKGKAITKQTKSVSQQVESDILISNKIDRVTIKQSHQIADCEDKPEFLEIQATSVGYEKHILERILEWLDNLMLWLEDKFVRILKFISAIMGVKL